MNALRVTIAAAVTLVTASSAAQAPYTLEWTAPAECPDRAAVVREVDRLTRAATATDASRLDVRAEVVRGPQATFRLSVRAFREAVLAGERTLEDGRCEALAGALAVMVALMIDPESALAQSADPSDPPARGRVILSAFALADLGTLSRAAAGGGLELRVELLRDGDRPWLAIVLRALVLPPVEARVAAESPARADLALAVGALGAFVPILVWRGVALGPTAGIEVGAMWGEGAGVSNPAGAAVLWIAAFGSLRLDIELGPAVITVDVGVSVPPSRPTFVLDGVGDLHEPSALAGRAAVGLGIRF